MTDRKDIITGLETVAECVYFGRTVPITAYVRILEAVEALKEQEPVKPRFVDGKRNHFVKCGSCNLDLMHGMKFCPNCGKAVKWNAETSA